MKANTDKEAMQPGPPLVDSAVTRPGTMGQAEGELLSWESARLRRQAGRSVRNSTSCSPSQLSVHHQIGLDALRVLIRTRHQIAEDLARRISEAEAALQAAERESEEFIGGASAGIIEMAPQDEEAGDYLEHDEAKVALIKMMSGERSICGLCDRRIPLGRLLARPQAKLCRRCDPD